MGRYGNGVQRAGDTVVRHVRRPRCPRTQPNTVTLPLRTRPTNVNKLHYPTLGQIKTQLTSTETDVPATQAGYNEKDHRQQRDGTHTNPADHEAAATTAHQPHRSCRRHMTVNRPHASKPKPSQPGVHGSEGERRPTGWRNRGAPRPLTTMPTNTTEHRNSTITNAANQR